MISLEELVKYNAQTAGREKFIRLLQYASKFAQAVLQEYSLKTSAEAANVLNAIRRLRELEQHFGSCRRVISFGTCIDHVYSAGRAYRLFDPIVRTTQAMSKLFLSFQMFSDHVLWLNELGVLRVERHKWQDKLNQFWLYSVTINLFRDFYELICVIQASRTRRASPKERALRDRAQFQRHYLRAPIHWVRANPTLSCDIAKNLCDFWIPYAALNRLQVHSALISLLGIVSTSMAILQVYKPQYRLAPQ